MENTPILHEYENAEDAILKPLDPKEQLFLNEYLKDFKIAEAARRANLSDSFKKNSVYALLRKPNFQHALRVALNEIKIQHQAQVMKVIKWLNDVIALDPLDYIESISNSPSIGGDGAIQLAGIEFKDLRDIPKELRQLIQGIHNTREGLRVTFVDKLKAAELLGKYYGIYTDEHVTNNNLIMNQTQVFNKIYINHRATGKPLDVVSG